MLPLLKLLAALVVCLVLWPLLIALLTRVLFNREDPL